MKPVSASRGFTLIELMIVVAVIAILASIALPSYQNYVKKGHANTAAADLSALASSVENHFQRTLSYHTGELDGLTALTATDKFPTWAPASKDHFTFKYKKTEKGLYELTATGDSTQMSGCDLKLEQDNTRTPTSPDSKCGGFKW